LFIQAKGDFIFVFLPKKIDLFCDVVNDALFVFDCWKKVDWWLWIFFSWIWNFFSGKVFSNVVMLTNFCVVNGTSFVETTIIGIKGSGQIFLQNNFQIFIWVISFELNVFYAENINVFNIQKNIRIIFQLLKLNSHVWIWIGFEIFQ